VDDGHQRKRGIKRKRRRRWGRGGGGEEREEEREVKMRKVGGTEHK